MTNITKRHAGQIDALRALAVLAVLFSHTIDERYAIGKFLFFEFGSYGGYLSFILSACLITSQLPETRKARADRGDAIGAPLARVYGKRALRLFPAYYLALAASLPGSSISDIFKQSILTLSGDSGPGLKKSDGTIRWRCGLHPHGYDRLVFRTQPAGSL